MKITEITAEKKEKTIQRLAAYCRVSSDSEDQLHSFAAQVCYYTNYEKQNPDVELVGIYADEGLSGTSMKNRSELQRLIQDCQKGKIDRIVTKSVSRLARNTQDLLNTIRLFKSLDVSVYFEEQGIDTLQMNSELFLTFPGMVAQQESESISGNMRWSYKKRMESGEFNCCHPAYGFDLVNGELIINEKEAAVVRRIFDMYLQGMGKQHIADILNKDLVSKKYSDTKWNQRMISYILINERYIGDAILQKTYTTNNLPFKTHLNKGEKTQYYVKNANPAIVSKEIFNAAQDFRRKRIFQKRKGEKNILSQILYCRKCGRSFRRLTTGKSFYWISSINEQSDCDCIKHRLKESAIFDTFSLMTYKIKVNQITLIDELIHHLEEMSIKGGENSEKINKLDKQIAQLCAQKHVLTKLKNNGVLSSTDYAMQASEIENMIAEHRADRKKLLSEDQEDELMDEIKLLKTIIESSKPSPGFDADLFGKVVKKVYVIDNSTIKFKLLGDIEFTETIDERLRCKQLCAKGQSYTATDIKTV